MELTITQVTHYDKRKDNTPLKDKNGNQYYRAVVKTQEYGQEFLSGFVYQQLQEGQKIQADVKEEMYNGKLQRKFELMRKEKPAGSFTEQDRELLQKTFALLVKVENMLQFVIKPQDDNYPNNDLGDSPF